MPGTAAHPLPRFGRVARSLRKGGRSPVVLRKRREKKEQKTRMKREKRK